MQLFTFPFGLFRVRPQNMKIYDLARSFLFVLQLSCHLVWIDWGVSISKLLRILFVSFSKNRFCSVPVYSVGYESRRLHSFQWITFPTQPCLLWEYFLPNLLHSLIIWLIVSIFISKQFTLALFLCFIQRYIFHYIAFSCVLCISAFI